MRTLRRNTGIRKKMADPKVSNEISKAVVCILCFSVVSLTASCSRDGVTHWIADKRAEV